MKRLKRLLYSWIDRQFLGGCSNYNPLAVRRRCRSKSQAREMFARHEIPCAQGTVFFNPWTAIRFTGEHGFPLVVKPNISGFSRGSHFPITSYRELWRGMLLARLWWPISVVEQYLEGRNYRVLVVKGEIMSVIRRYPPFVDGDGILTISELIDQENRIREELGLLPVIHHIPKDSRIRSTLSRQGLSLYSVPAKGRRVQLFNRIALAPGGVVEIIDQTSLPAENRELFLKVLDLFDANILGIDVIFEQGIEVDYRKQKTILLEVNSRPYMKMHHFPRFGQAEDLSQFYSKLDSLEIEGRDIF